MYCRIIFAATMKFLLVLCAVLYTCSALPNSRIVGGEVAEAGSVPYIVSLRTAEDNDHYCGGSLIRKDWILTAGHCVGIGAEKSIKVVVGTNKLNRGGSIYNVEKIVLHPNYGNPENDDDIALIKLTDEVTLTDRVQVIPLSSETIVGGESLRLNGWGLTRPNGVDLPNDLQELQLVAQKQRHCESFTGSANTQICAFIKRGKGTCNGDSGGPLAYNGELVGVASYVLDNCAQGFPDFFTRVSLYNDWIETSISEN